MKFWSTILAALFTMALITGCGPKEEAAQIDEPAPAGEVAPVEESAPAAEAPASNEPGGYEPTDDERVPPYEETSGS
jgi:hypothetical protein